MTKHIPVRPKYGLTIALIVLCILAIRSNYLTRELPTVYVNSEGSCIASKPMGLCYDKTLKEHNRVLLDE